MHLGIGSWDHQQMNGLANETAAYALLTRTLRASYADCTISHTFLDPLYLPLLCDCGWRNRDVYLVIQTCLMQQRVVVVVVVAAAAAVVVVGSNNNNWSRLPSHQSGIVQSMVLVGWQIVSLCCVLYN